MLTDIFVASVEDANDLLNGHSNTNNLPRISAKNLDQIKLATLRFILSGLPLEVKPVVEYSASFQDFTASEDGPWVYVIPDDVFTVVLLKISGLTGNKPVSNADADKA
jgi:hypothetical protein